ncbi:MAG TPA: hypothetical protein VNO21_10740, partial [Polyangiaceae bacterium]|nr:hypothetical protein [Polyangiaceae bacterium]
QAVLRSRAHALLCTLLVATNASFAAYATGGLETQLVTFTMLLSISCACTLARHPTGRVMGFAGASVLSLWIRLDSAVLVAPFGIMLMHELIMERRWRRLGELLVVSAAGLALLLGFKIHVFGAMLPVTFFAKASGAGVVVFLRGIEYVVAFFTHYGLFLPAALALAGFARARPEPSERRHLFTMLAAIALWSSYVCKVGGDFMEFRFLVPVFPLMVVVLAWGVRELAVPALLPIVGGALVAHSVIYMYNTYDESILMEGTNIETIHGLQMHLESPRENWVGIGRFLGARFGGSDVTISLGAAGAIPYYSGLRTVDIFGLSDPWIARYGAPYGSRPGHSRVAPLSYLQKSRVVLAIWWAPLPGEKAPDDAVWVDIPISADLIVPALYLTKNAAIDALIAREGWKTRPAD